MIHICSVLMLAISAWEDIRKRQIYILPVIVFMGIGLIFHFFKADFEWKQVLYGMLPGALSILMSKVGNDCIGSGDSLLLLAVGSLEGITFSVKWVSMTCVFILGFSMIMLACGKLHRKSKVACAPFLLLGYIGVWLI